MTNKASSVEVSRGTSSHTWLPPAAILSSAARWSRKYDVFVCHSSTDTDIEEAKGLVTFLEATPRCFRCFLWHRDSSPGAAIFSELCQAMQDSHCTALLITPLFLCEEWCQYMLQQALVVGPMSNRTIPLIQNLPRAQYPPALKCLWFVDLSRNIDRGYELVCSALLKCK